MAWIQWKMSKERRGGGNFAVSPRHAADIQHCPHVVPWAILSTRSKIWGHLKQQQEGGVRKVCSTKRNPLWSMEISNGFNLVSESWVISANYGFSFNRKTGERMAKTQLLSQLASWCQTDGKASLYHQLVCNSPQTFPASPTPWVFNTHKPTKGFNYTNFQSHHKYMGKLC